MIRSYAILGMCILACIILAGCAHDAGKIELQTVNVPVPVHCKPNIKPSETFPDTDQALKSAPDIFERVKLLLAGRDLRTARVNELEVALQACE
jgi:hypothetical protein